MTEREALSLIQRLGVWLGDIAIRLSVGHPAPHLAEEVVRQMGFSGLMKLPGISRTIQTTMKHFGERDAQMLIAFAALWNGCLYCSRGHVLAAALYHLRDHDQIFPVDEARILELRQLRDTDALDHTSDLLADPKFDRLRDLLRRQFELRFNDAEVEMEEDRYIALTLSAWDWVTECTVMIDPDLEIAPLAPIVHDRALMERYRAGGAS